jgi:hypothetical protein
MDGLPVNETKMSLLFVSPTARTMSLANTARPSVLDGVGVGVDVVVCAGAVAAVGVMSTGDSKVEVITSVAVSLPGSCRVALGAYVAVTVSIVSLVGAAVASGTTVGFGA